MDDTPELPKQRNPGEIPEHWPDFMKEAHLKLVAERRENPPELTVDDVIRRALVPIKDLHEKIRIISPVRCMYRIVEPILYCGGWSDAEMSWGWGNPHGPSKWRSFLRFQIDYDLMSRRWLILPCPLDGLLMTRELFLELGQFVDWIIEYGGDAIILDTFDESGIEIAGLLDMRYLNEFLRNDPESSYLTWFPDTESAYAMDTDTYFSAMLMPDSDHRIFKDDDSGLWYGESRSGFHYGPCDNPGMIYGQMMPFAGDA